MTKRLTITFTDEQAELIEKIATAKGITFADTVRRLCDEAIKLQMTNENIDMVVEIIDERLRAILKPQVERLASISVKGAIMSATSTFLNAQVINDFVPKEKRKDFNTVYEKARLKGVAYVKQRVNDIDDINKDIEE